ncbi:hypothetical protein, partial [uncultured Tateyamaria sp.]|uniref:hypothetical protein n=1 Tax=uncultured Tateyamaria sp. TaxID=455651 RepID=UPI002639D174
MGKKKKEKQKRAVLGRILHNTMLLGLFTHITQQNKNKNSQGRKTNERMNRTSGALAVPHHTVPAFSTHIIVRYRMSRHRTRLRYPTARKTMNPSKCTQTVHPLTNPPKTQFRLFASTTSIIKPYTPKHST